MTLEIASEEASIGTTLRLDAMRTSSIATKFSGSAIAIYTQSLSALTGATLCFFAIERGSTVAISLGSMARLRSMYFTFSCFSKA